MIYKAGITVDVLGVPVVVKLQEGLLLKDNSILEGCYEPATSSITIIKAATTDSMNETMLHELLHAVADATCTQLTEEQIYRLSRALYATGVRPPVMFSQTHTRKHNP